MRILPNRILYLPTFSHWFSRLSMKLSLSLSLPLVRYWHGKLEA